MGTIVETFSRSQRKQFDVKSFTSAVYGDTKGRDGRFKAGSADKDTNMGGIVNGDIIPWTSAPFDPSSNWARPETYTLLLPQLVREGELVAEDTVERSGLVMATKFPIQPSFGREQ